MESEKGKALRSDELDSLCEAEDSFDEAKGVYDCRRFRLNRVDRTRSDFERQAGAARRRKLRLGSIASGPRFVDSRSLWANRRR